MTDLLDPKKDEKFFLVLADTGMGKTTLLLNYFALYCRRGRSRSLKIRIINLSYRSADELISQGGDQSNTILFLDAFDEDVKAIKDYRKRIKDLLDRAGNYAKVVVTCRTQFFERDEEIPSETGVIRIGQRSMGEPRTHQMRKIYLSPFDDKKIDEYLKLAFPLWNYKRRSHATNIAGMIPDLTVRPMLLAHIEDLIERPKGILRVSDIYCAMVDAWIMRDSDFVEPQNIRSFSERLAYEIYSGRESRGSERITAQEAMTLGRELLRYPLEQWKLRSRSLLNRDAAGNYKFSHRSIMEYLFICDFTRTRGFVRHNRKKVPWTDQMKRFWWDILDTLWNGPDRPGVVKEAMTQISRAHRYGDLSGLYALGLRPIVKLRFEPLSGAEIAFEEQIARLSSHNVTHRVRTKQFPGLFEGGSSGPDGEDDAFVDHLSGLMWESECYSAPAFHFCTEHIKDLNEVGFGGFSDWRLPTLEEVLSLLPSGPNSGISQVRPKCFDGAVKRAMDL